MAKAIKQYPDSNLGFGETFETRLASSLLVPANNESGFANISTDIIGVERATILHQEITPMVMQSYEGLETDFSETFHGILMPVIDEPIGNYNEFLWELINNRNDDGFIPPDSYYNIVLATLEFPKPYETNTQFCSKIPTVVEVEHARELSQQTKRLMDIGPSMLSNMFDIVKVK